MIDHIGIPVSDMTASKAFYAQALAPLGYSLLLEYGENVAGFGADNKPDFWLHPADQVVATHVAFAAADRAVVDAFHVAALASGAQDNGAPGLRPQYHPDYYGAFVLDPDGHNIEAVCHAPG